MQQLFKHVTQKLKANSQVHDFDKLHQLARADTTATCDLSVQSCKPNTYDMNEMYS